MAKVRILLAALLALGVGATGIVLAAPAQAAAVTATFSKVQDWGSGYEAKMTITNGTGSTVNGWTVAFDLPAGSGVGSYWDALLTSSGNRHTFRNREYNGTLAAGASTTFGWIGRGSGVPAGCTVNGAPCGGGPAPTTPPPTSVPPTSAPPTSAPPTTPPPTGGTPVATNGQLRVCGTKLCNQRGTPVQLRGMSTHGIQWFPNCYSSAAFDALATDWRADVVRISMYVQEGGYETNPRLFTDRVHSYIEQVSARGMYVIVDWHMLDPGDPNYNLSRARTFFTEIAQRHAGKPNIIYEVANEPSGVSWSSIKSYAEQIIPVIRAQDPDGVVLVGTRAWSSLGVSEGSNENEVANNQVNATNIMYTFHFYAASHGQNYLDTLSRAADRIPMFVTEFGTQTSSGDGTNDFNRAQQYLNLMATKQISWVNWNFSDDSRTGAVFTTGTCPNGPYAGTSRLKPAGTWIRDRIRNR
ncbi:cellulase family glycosylhydrolase [Phytohabitans houttuyneae]|uniref:Endoglucanase n=1 Tax=Phytohabitans houttuyneae TaxID=1076126 RepID=A0A6V8KVK5_9ACTN|nr:cellulase family glycosylhydrolase [Phytohabitans houttuyneae]GFJ85866.1 endoglucanase [Phytohabitans houttuyneae]